MNDSPPSDYTLSIKAGTVSAEAGTFFRALPFSVTPENGNRYEVRFERGAKEKVVFKIFSAGEAVANESVKAAANNSANSDNSDNSTNKVNQTMLAEWDHPDYVPEEATGEIKSPETLSPALAEVMSAFTHLGIVQEEGYVKAFHPSQGGKTLSFTVQQSAFPA